MEVVSTNNTADIGTIIHSGTLTGGSATTIVDTGADFTAGTPVAVGDTVILNKSASPPEFGKVTAVAATTLTVANGFSRGQGGAAGKTYQVLDYSATTGAQAVQIGYLDGDYVNDSEIVILNGTTVVPTVQSNLYRINGFRVVAAGSSGVAAGTISLRNLADTPIYNAIAAGATYSRCSQYTVAAGYSLYITDVTFSFGYAANQTHYCRLFLKARQMTQRNGDLFRTQEIFYPYSEIVAANSAQQVSFTVPTKFGEKVDLKVSGISSVASGAASVVIRGWLEIEHDE
jgi:hypothetical protein